MINLFIVWLIAMLNEKMDDIGDIILCVKMKIAPSNTKNFLKGQFLKVAIHVDKSVLHVASVFIEASGYPRNRITTRSNPRLCWVSIMVLQWSCKPLIGVRFSDLAPYAGVAQLVEYLASTQRVAGSSPVTRSII